MIPSRRIRTASALTCLALSATLFVGTSGAQSRFEWPQRAKNLKVLPKDTPKEKLQGTMIGFTRALGVRCPFCHVGQEGQPLTTFDFVSDEKPMKQVARGMMKMVRDVEKDLKKIKFQEPNRVNVACVTCHRGRPRPMTLAEELTSVYQTAGIDSTVARYRMLRGRFYGAGSYDFSERSLNELGTALQAQGHPADAVLILQLNVEQNPNSSFAYSSLAEAYAAAGQKDLAIQNYEKAIALDPRNREADQKLKELRGGGK
jgi:tetratricopeptide repeat protein/photosynthetic reaction center cytochrome c subunit